MLHVMTSSMAGYHTCRQTEATVASGATTCPFWLCEKPGCARRGTSVSSATIALSSLHVAKALFDCFIASIQCVTAARSLHVLEGTVAKPVVICVTLCKVRMDV